MAIAEAPATVLFASRSTRSRPWLRYALAFWGALLIAASIKPLVQPEKHTVYPIFANAARQWWRDENLYEKTEGLDGYRYSPTFAVVFSPLAILPDGLGGAIWNAGSVLALLFALRAFVREVLPGEWPAWREAAFLMLVAIGNVRGVWGGQSNAIILSLVLWGAVALRKEQWWRAAGLLAIPVFIKIWPLAIVLLFGLRWPKQLSWRFPLACAALALIPCISRRPEVVQWQYENWFAALTGPLQVHKAEYRDGWTIWETLVGSVDPEMFKRAELVGALLVAAWCASWVYRRMGESEFLIFTLCLWSCFQMLLGPGTERMTYGLVAPALAWAVLVSPPKSLQFWLACVAWLATTILGAGEVERLLLPYLPWAKILQPGGVVLLSIWLVGHWWSGNRVVADRQFPHPDPSVRMRPRGVTN